MSEKIALLGGSPVRKSALSFFMPTLGESECRAVADVVRSKWITSGPVVAEFERAVKRMLGCHNVVALSSCTAGLEISLDAMRVGRGDEAITTPLTFVSTANAIVHRGSRVRFADVKEDTLTIDPDSVAGLINKRTRAIVPVHLAGQPCDMDALLRVAKRSRLCIIEDAAHAFGAKYKGRFIGKWGDVTVFSFHAVKNITMGEGGLISARKDSIAKKIRQLAFHGMDTDAWQRTRKKDWRYLVHEAGYKANLTDMQAAIGLVQLKRFAGLQRRREAIVESYHKAFKDIPELIVPLQAKNTLHSWHVYLLRLCTERIRVSRDDFLRALLAEGIIGNVHYHPVHLQPFYRREFGYRQGMLPVAEKAAKQIVTLPLYPSMSEKDVQDVIDAVRKLIEWYRR